MRDAVTTLKPWALVVLGYVLLFGAMFAPVWARGASIAVGDGLMQSGPACYGPHGFWTTGFLLGYPLAADPTQMRFYPMSALCPMPGALEVLVMSPYVLAATGMTGFVRALTGSWLGGIVAGLAFALGGFEIAHAGHVMIATPAAWSPFILWSFEAMRRNPQSRLPLAGGAIASALCVLGGQPQTPVFAYTLAGAYALVTFRGAAQPLAYLARCALALALGAALSAIQLLPEYELAIRSTRAAISYVYFSGDAVPLAQLPVYIAFPYLLGGSGGNLYGLSSGSTGWWTEYADSSGLALVFAAALGALAPRAPQRWFWIAVVLLGWALSVGPALGLTLLTYHLPVYSLFREPGRHAFESGFALAVLSGFGVAALRQRALPFVRSFAAAVGTAAFGLGAWLIFASGAIHAAIALTNADNQPLAAHASPLNPAIAIPLAAWALCVALALYGALRRDARAAYAFALALGAGALLFAWGGYWNWGALPRAAYQPPAIARDVRAALAPAHQRLLSDGGPDGASLFPNLTLVWGVPTVAGYLSLIPQNLQLLLDFTPQGVLQPDNFSEPNGAVLDLVGARLVLVDPNLVQSEHSSTEPFGSEKLAVFLGGREVVPMDSIDFYVGAPIRANRLALLDTLGFAVEIPQGTKIGEVVVRDARGRHVFPLRAGIESAEAAYDRPDVRPRMRHRAAKTVREEGGYRMYETDVKLDPNAQVRSVTIRRTYRDPQSGALSIYGASLVDDRDDTALALGPMSYVRSDPSVWRPRTIDGVQFYDNAKALPRAWVPQRVVVADDATALGAMRRRKAGGDVFDGRRVAYVPEAHVALERARGTVTIERVDDASMTLRADCATACLVMTSDLWYPGWVATVDGKRVPVERVDVALRGVLADSGTHEIVFRYVPYSIAAGAAITLLVALALALWSLRPAIVRPKGLPAA